MFWSLTESGLRQGLLLVPLALGIHVAFRFVRYPDLTADGSLLVGSAVCTTATLYGVSPLFAILAGAVGGGMLGAVTALLSEKLGVDRIIAGMATSLAAYTVALRVLGRGNVAVPIAAVTIFSGPTSDIAVAAFAALVLVFIVSVIAKTRAGLRVRAAGENGDLAAQLGGSVAFRTTAGLLWANMCVALSGSLLAQHERFVDISQGAGTLFIGLACVLIGSALPVGYHLVAGLVSSACGAILYAFLISLALSVGFAPGDLKAITAALVVLTVWAGQRVFPTERRLSLFP